MTKTISKIEYQTFYQICRYKLNWYQKFKYGIGSNCFGDICFDCLQFNDNYNISFFESPKQKYLICIRNLNELQDKSHRNYSEKLSECVYNTIHHLINKFKKDNVAFVNAFPSEFGNHIDKINNKFKEGK